MHYKVTHARIDKHTVVDYLCAVSRDKTRGHVIAIRHHLDNGGTYTVFMDTSDAQYVTVGA